MAHKQIDTRCGKCDRLFEFVWADEAFPVCCDQETHWTPSRVNTNEWGGPRQLLHIRDEPFGSRSELESYAKENGMSLGASNDKVGGARNEEHLDLGKIYSYSK